VTLIELHDADVVLGGRTILHRVSLAVHDGEHAAILGPNGAGKSTLIKLVTLQLYPVARDGGVAPIRVFEQERWDVFALRSRLGIVSADLHDRFVHGNANGIVTGLDAVLSGFFATQGIFAHQTITGAMRTCSLLLLSCLILGGELISIGFMLGLAMFCINAITGGNH